MKIVYKGVTGDPLHCVKFYGITVLQSGQVQGLFLVFELASGGSIDEYLYTRAMELEWNDVLTLFYDIATGLEELHHRGITHGFFLIIITN